MLAALLTWFLALAAQFARHGRILLVIAWAPVDSSPEGAGIRNAGIRRPQHGSLPPHAT